MFVLIDFVGMEEREIGSFKTREEAIAVAEEKDLIGLARMTFGEEGALIRHEGHEEIL